MKLAKAELVCIDDKAKSIVFMFNPSELSFQGDVETSENSGASTKSKGTAKVSFSNIKPYKVIISNILFDTYEDGGDVVKKYINKFKTAVELSPIEKRTPMYQFKWGTQIYLRACFVEQLNYKLTMFLPDGTPVRALIEQLTLKEADEPKPNQSLKAPEPDEMMRKIDTLQNRAKTHMEMIRKIDTLRNRAKTNMDRIKNFDPKKLF